MTYKNFVDEIQSGKAVKVIGEEEGGETPALYLYHQLCVCWHLCNF